MGTDLSAIPEQLDYRLPIHRRISADEFSDVDSLIASGESEYYLDFCAAFCLPPDDTIMEGYFYAVLHEYMDYETVTREIGTWLKEYLTLAYCDDDITELPHFEFIG